MRFALVLALLAAGCSDDPTPTEVWSPDDHAQPPRQSVDPSRVPRERRPQQPEARGPEDRAAAAATLWRISCAGCHGAEGRGDGEGYEGALADFTDPEWQASVTDEQIARAITLGQPPMPAFGDILAPQGIAALVEHVRRYGSESDADPDADADSDADADPDADADADADAEN